MSCTQPVSCLSVAILAQAYQTRRVNLRQRCPIVASVTLRLGITMAFEYNEFVKLHSLTSATGLTLNGTTGRLGQYIKKSTDGLATTGTKSLWAARSVFL